MATEGERLATVEAVLHDLRGDVGELKDESFRTRGRLHDLEGLATTLVEQEKTRIRVTREQQDALRTRLQILTVVIALAAFLEPFLYHLALGG